ncbi:MAG: carboxypeptidase-like regulatory domain-containing protein, partial [Rhodospirillaceae bacterium]
MFVIRAWALGLALLFTPAQAQERQGGAIRGTIVDSLSGRSISGAEVTLADVDKPTMIVLITGSDGSFTFTKVPEGLYTLGVTRPGYLDALEIDVRAVAGRTTRTDFQMARQPLALDEILVTTKAVGATQFGSVTATRLGREEIRRGAGTAGDIFRGLDVLPGVANTGEFSNFTVRGRGPRDNL